MTMNIIDFDVLSEDKHGRARFVVFLQQQIDLEIGTIVKAIVVASKADEAFPCEIYQPRPNGPLDPAHLHMRADPKYRLDKVMAIGDVITIV